jgi:hypothetical protein
MREPVSRSRRSRVAAATPHLRQALLDTIRWDLRDQPTTGGNR